MIYPLLFFTLFASIHGSVQIISHIIGFVYVLLLFIQLILYCKSCGSAIQEETDDGIIHSIIQAKLYEPCIRSGIFYILLEGFFLYRGVRAVFYLILKKPFSKQHTVNHHIGYVKRLLNGSTPTTNAICKVIHVVTRYQWDPYFKFSLRIISAGVVIMVALLKLTISSVEWLLLLSDFISLEYSSTAFGTSHTHLGKAIDAFLYTTDIIIPFSSLALVLAGFLTSLVAYRRQCKLLWKGDRSFLPKKQRPFARTLVSSINFFGFQVALAVWAWMMYFIILLVIQCVIVAIIIVMIVNPHDIRDWIFHHLIFLITSLATGYIIYYIQFYAAKYLFVSKDAALINNRRLFHFYTFFLLFYYMLVGLFKAIQRIIISAALNLLYLSRLDIALTVTGWEWLDKAHSSYISVLKIDANHNNPVMNVFINLLLQAKCHRSESQGVPVFNKIRNRDTDKSNVPLLNPESTNVNNPQLIELRRRDYNNEAGYIDDVNIPI
ncbi:stimulated by retinoic acid gene 6 protein-like isoform X2 [Dysidea avara]|uniref:stimulated by retinoic acid gene 6 protein-like isoform X2 n=1 Tax=Dysidea avara TaxID=196820 RepID=UPI0033204D30